MRHTLFRRVTGVVGAALTAALLVTGLPESASAAGPGAPHGLTPADTDVSGQPVLTWTRVAGAAEYDVQISASDSFGTTLYSGRTENRRATPTANLPTGDELYWRVRGVSSSGTTGTWSAASFTLTPGAAPQLQSPPDAGEPLVQPDQPPLLSWDLVPGAIGYIIEVDNDDLFIGPSVYSAKNTSYLLANPGPEQTYFWRVRAKFADGYEGQNSEAWSFTIQALPAPDLVYPDDSSMTQITDAVLDWVPVPGAVQYEVRVSSDEQFNTIVDSDIVKSTRYARPTSLNNDQYWWQVRAIDVNGNKSPWTTSLRQFQRYWPDQPELLYPEDGDVNIGRSMFYEWSPVPLASEYVLQVARDPSFSPGQFDECTTKNTSYAPQRTTNSRCTPTRQGTYYWRVRAFDGPASPIINGIFSEIHSFSYEPGLVEQHEVLSELVPTLSWEPFEGALKYDVTVYEASGSVAASATTYATAWTPTGNNRLKATDGPFRWAVSAIGSDGFESATPLPADRPEFEIVSDAFSNEGPILTPTSDENSHTLQFPQLTWEPDPGAAYYRVSVARSPSTTFSTLGDRFPYPAGTDDTTTYLVAGDYSWFVTSYTDKGAFRSTGPIGTFTIDPLETVTQQTVSLTGLGLQNPDTSCNRRLDGEDGPELCNGLQQTPAFGWDRVPGAGYYMIYQYKDRELTNLIETANPPTSLATANNMYTMTSQMKDSTAGTAYYWAIRPCKAPGFCAPEPTEATNAFDKRSNPVEGLLATQHESDEALESVAANDTSTPRPQFEDEIVLSWDDYLATNQLGAENDVTGLRSTVEAKTYTVQISTNPNFTSGNLTMSGIDQTTYTPFNDTLPEGPLYWRVQAVDGTGNALAWSQPQAIEKRSPTPTLMSPIGNQTVSTTPPLTWEPLNYAAMYEIQIAEDGDATFSHAIVSETNLKQATYALKRTLDPDGSPYTWRVRRIDVDGRKGGWSTTGRFSVKADAPTLISPAADKRVSGKDALFTWSGVAGAERYRFERRYEGATSTRESVRTVGVNWAPKSILAKGRYEWRVVALDADGRVVGASGWRNFMVDDDAPRILQRSPSSSGTRTSNFKVIFDERVKGATSSNMRIYAKGSARKLSAKVTLTKQGTVATLNPAANLKSNKDYVVKLSSKITDAYGNKLKPYTYTVHIS